MQCNYGKGTVFVQTIEAGAGWQLLNVDEELKVKYRSHHASIDSIPVLALVSEINQRNSQNFAPLLSSLRDIASECNVEVNFFTSSFKVHMIC